MIFIITGWTANSNLTRTAKRRTHEVTVIDLDYYRLKPSEVEFYRYDYKKGKMKKLGTESFRKDVLIPSKTFGAGDIMIVKK